MLVSPQALAMISAMKRLFRRRVSRATVVSSATTAAKLTRYVSELINFGPTKCAAEVVLKMLEMIKAVDENDDACILLIKRIIDVLLLIREHFDETGAVMPPKLNERMQEFEFVLLNIHDKLRISTKRSFFSRAISKDKIKSDLATHSATLDAAIGRLNLSLLLEVTVATQVSLVQTNREVEYTSQSMALVHPHQRDPDEEFLDHVGALYDEVRIGDIRLIPPEDEAERSFARFSDLNVALVRGEKRLIKSFDGDDDVERKNWIREVKQWHRLKHPNVLQLQGITNRASPHLYVIFQNSQARCLANFLINAMNKQDVPSVAAFIMKMTNAAVSAIKHVRSKLRVDEATSVLAVEDATFALDSGNNLLLALNLVKPRSKGTQQVGLRHTLQELFWPPTESRNVPQYFKRLTASHDVPGQLNINTSEIRTAVNAFLADHVHLEDVEGEHFISPKLKPGWTERPIFSASMDCGTAVKAGDYGILVPGQQEDFAFLAYGNAIDDSPAIVCATTETKLPDYTSDGLAELVQQSPRVWRSDLNETRRKGFSSLQIHWYHLQNLMDISRAVRFLVNSVPLLRCDDACEGIILITKVVRVKTYRISIDEQTSDDLRSEDESQRKGGRPLPFVHATEPESPEDELRFSQFPPNLYSRDAAGSAEVWDSRVSSRRKMRELKRIRYVQLRKEDIINRFGFVPALNNSRRICNADPVCRIDQRWFKFCREYELTERGSGPWCLLKPVAKEYP